jgi:hypothetical protein
MNQLFSSVSHPNDNLFNKLSAVISGRLTIGSAIAKVEPFLPFIGSEIISQAIRGWKSALPYEYISSRMKQCFHGAPDFSFASSKQTQETLTWLNKKLGKKFQLKANIKTATDALDVLELGEELMECVGAVGISKYVKTTGKPKVSNKPTRKPSRKNRALLMKIRDAKLKQEKRATCRAELVLSCDNVTRTQKTLPSWKKLYFGDYKRAVKFVSKFMGRVHTWFDAWVRAQAGVISKVGLVNIALHKHDYDLKNYPMTLVFLALASSEFSVRKEFTLESQKQGGLNTHLRSIFNEIVEKERGGLKYIAYMIPAKEIWEHVDETFLIAIRAEWLNWMTVFSIVLEKQWKKGVKKSSHRLMRVLPGTHWQGSKRVAKSGVNSNLWNVVADSWNSGASYLRGIDVVLQKPVSFWGKTLQLVANDQFMWGSTVGKSTCSDVPLFRELTKEILPWHIVHPEYKEEFDSVRALQTFFKCTSELGIENPKSWLELPALRSAEVKIHRDLICGCSVPAMSQELFDYLSNSGIFGATGWSGV